MFSALSRLILKLWGWKITGSYPYDLPKIIVAVGPHTSNWDFPIGVLLNSAMKIHANYVGKHTLFRPPFGFIFKYLGGIPVDKTKRSRFVENTIAAINARERVHLAISPEGTRKKVDKLRTGFYHIAKGTNSAICLCKFDWENMELFFDPQLFYPTADEAADLDFIWNYFKNVQGRNPELGIS